MAAKVKKFILDTIFPVECLGCKREGEWLCGECSAKIKLDMYSGHRKFLARVLAFYSYDNEILKKAIHSLKYKFIEELAEPLGELFIEGIRRDNFRPDTDFLIIPVPLHRKRFLERGFNQAEMLARAVAEKFRVEVSSDALERERWTESQVNLEEGERQKNVEGAFKLLDSSKILNKRIILVDDVLTTGATMEACAKVLGAGGAKEVWAMALVKG